MREKTPTIEQARHAYCDGLSGTSRTRAESITEFDRMIAEVERAAAARALEEFADQMTTGFNAGTLNAERRAIKREARARVVEIREGNE